MNVLTIQNLSIIVKINIYQSYGFPYGSGGEESVSTAEVSGDTGFIPGLGRSPGEGNGNILHYSCLENHMDGQRSLAGYSTKGLKESDTLSN